jgi:hypothetical protein
MKKLSARYAASPKAAVDLVQRLETQDNRGLDNKKLRQ